MTDVVSTEGIRQEIAPVIDRAIKLFIDSPAAYLDAAENLKDINWGIKMVEEHFAPMKQATNAAHMAVCNKEKEVLDPLRMAKKKTSASMSSYRQLEERQRLLEESRLQAEAEERARKERERLEKEAAKLKSPELREQRLEQAAQVQAPQVYVSPITPTVKGISLRKVWKAVIEDPQQAIHYLLEWPDWSSYITLNQTELNRLAARTKGTLDLPGCRFVEESSMSSTAERRSS